MTYNIFDSICYKNGELIKFSDAGPSLLDFGFIHCDATYDVIPVRNNKFIGFDLHINRLKNSCNYFNLEMPDLDYFVIMQQLLHTNNLTDAFAWVIVWRGYPSSGNPRDIKSCPVNCVIYVKPYYGINNSNLIKLKIETVHRRVGKEHVNQVSKNFSWIEFTKSQVHLDYNIESALLLDTRGYITEGPGFNVGFVVKDTIITPKENCLQGVTMQLLEQLAKSNNINFKYTDITVDQAMNADAIFISSSSGGVTPAYIVNSQKSPNQLLLGLIKLYKEQYE